MSKIKHLSPEEQEEVFAEIKGQGPIQYYNNFLRQRKPTKIEDVQPMQIEANRPHEIIQRSAQEFKVQKEHLARTLLRFLHEIDAWLQET